MKGFLAILGLLLPHFFAATLSRRKPMDKRIVKYFLPYGMMKSRMRYVFHADVGNDKKDRGIVGLFRWCCPYGTILWWDGGRDTVSRPSPVPNRQLPGQLPGPLELGAVRRQIESLRREVMDGSERLELLMLRFIDSASPHDRISRQIGMSPITKPDITKE